VGSSINKTTENGRIASKIEKTYMTQSNVPYFKSIVLERLSSATLPLALLVAGLVLAQPPANAADRPISDFISRQGTYCLGLDAQGNVSCEASGYNGGADCFLFLPPTPNFVGQSDPQAGISASTDYAGLMNQTLISLSGGTKSLGTTMSGTVTEVLQPDGSAEVTVMLTTQNALTWAVQGFDFAASPLLFGHRVRDVAAGADAAVGTSHLKVIFKNSGLGAPLPDLEELLFCRLQGVKLISFQIRAEGTIRAAVGITDGTPGFLQTTQTGLIGTAFQNGFKGRLYDAFPAEHIIIRPTGK
jgi:hypothetical protein